MIVNKIAALFGRLLVDTASSRIVLGSNYWTVPYTGHNQGIGGNQWNLSGEVKNRVPFYYVKLPHAKYRIEVSGLPSALEEIFGVDNLPLMGHEVPLPIGEEVKGTLQLVLKRLEEEVK